MAQIEGVSILSGSRAREVAKRAGRSVGKNVQAVVFSILWDGNTTDSFIYVDDRTTPDELATQMAKVAQSMHSTGNPDA